MILVTGATGLLGSRLLADLADKGFPLKALCRKPPAATLPNVKWVEGDINDITSLEDAFENVDKVYHCAGMVSFLPSQRDVMHQVNISGTANVVNMALAMKIKKLCHVSSVAAIGRTGSDAVIDENGAWKTSVHNSSYAVSKYGAEREVWRGIAEGLNAVIVNPGIIIGPGNWITDSSMLFSRVWKGLKFYTRGISGFVDVRDVSSIMIRLMESDISSERFVLVSENKPFREVINRIADSIGVKRPSIYAGPLLTSLAWRSEIFRAMITGEHPVITRETARSANGKNFYSNQKIKNALQYEFIDTGKSIDDTGAVFKKWLALNSK